MKHPVDDPLRAVAHGRNPRASIDIIENGTRSSRHFRGDREGLLTSAGSTYDATTSNSPLRGNTVPVRAPSIEFAHEDGVHVVCEVASKFAVESPGPGESGSIGTDVSICEYVSPSYIANDCSRGHQVIVYQLIEV